ncbi:glycosyltransferase family 39 protein [Patescibacteria group bacterium]|nr:glycosyltransferase family 39 protein [Patescibacteria group bacterium]
MKKNFDLILIFLTTFIVASYFAGFGIDAHHDGLILKPALDVVNGKILFKETFTQYGALSVFVNAFLLFLFGKFLLTVRIASALFYALTAVFLFLIYKKFLNKRIVYVALISWLLIAPYYWQVFFPWPSIYAGFFLVLTIYLFLFSLKKEKRKIKVENKFVFLTGIASALAFWSKQPYLIVFFSIGFLFLLQFFLKVLNLRKTINSILILSLGFLSASSLFVFYFIFTGSLKDWFLQSIRIGYIWGRILGRGYDVVDLLRTILIHPVWLILPLSCLFFFFYVYSLLRKNPDDLRNLYLFGISLICIFSFFQYFPIYDPSHIYWSITPAVGLFAYVLFSFNLHKRVRNIKTYNLNQNLLTLFFFGITLITTISIISEIRIGINGAVEKNKKFNIKVVKPDILQGMRINQKDAYFYSDVSQNINKYLAKNPEKKLVVFDFDALYSVFAVNQENIDSFYANYSGYTSGVYSYEKDFYVFVKDKKPLILLNTSYLPFSKDYYIVKVWKDYNKALVAPI